MDEELKKIRERKMKELMEKTRGDKMDMEIEVNDNNFQEKVIEQSKNLPVVVDFWAQWCSPCLMLSPVLEKLVKEYNGKFVLAKSNIDEARNVAMQYRIMSIPSVKMFKKGKVIDGFVGVLPEPSVKEWLNKNLKVVK